MKWSRGPNIGWVAVLVAVRRCAGRANTLLLSVSNSVFLYRLFEQGFCILSEGFFQVEPPRRRQFGWETPLFVQMK